MMKSQGLTWVWDEGRTLWKMAVIRLILLPILHNRDSSQFVLDDNCLKAYIFPIIYIMERKKQANVSPKDTRRRLNKSLFYYCILSELC